MKQTPKQLNKILQIYVINPHPYSEDHSQILEHLQHLSWETPSELPPSSLLWVVRVLVLSKFHLHVLQVRDSFFPCQHRSRLDAHASELSLAWLACRQATFPTRC